MKENISRKHSRAAQFVICILCLTVTFTIMLTCLDGGEAFAASSKVKQSTVYSDVIVRGNNAYCYTAIGIYRVNLKTKAKKLVVKQDSWFGFGSYTGWTFKMHDGFFYFTSGTTAITQGLYRAKYNGKSEKALADIFDYVIQDNTIYYSTYSRNSSDCTVYRKMSLNGKNKKKSSYKVQNIVKKSNKKGYKLKRNYGETRATEYLITPSGKRIKLYSKKYDW